MAASSSYPTRSSDRARIAATQISTIFRTSPFQSHRKAIVGECRALKLGLDYYNAAHPSESPLQILFVFDADLAELEAEKWLRNFEQCDKWKLRARCWA
jgi:hypothetical protein